MSQPQKNIPQSIGIILDGNRRWARARGIPKYKGHEAGYAKLKEVISWVKDIGSQALTIYAFSTENWSREEEEVSHLMSLFKHALESDLVNLGKENIKIRFAGDVKRFPRDMQKMINAIEEKTRKNDGLLFVVCLSYGGRAEILHVAEKLVRGGKAPISEAMFEKYLWSAGVPDPDMIIRPGGEKRLSGFLTWQSVYSELFFTDTLWPDFSRQEFEKMIAEFNEREQNRGK